MASTYSYTFDRDAQVLEKIQDDLRVLPTVLQADKSNAVISIQALSKDNLYHLIAMINGPPNTPYENGYFLFEFELGCSYPFGCPTVRMITQIYHCNIHITENKQDYFNGRIDPYLIEHCLTNYGSILPLK